MRLSTYGITLSTPCAVCPLPEGLLISRAEIEDLMFELIASVSPEILQSFVICALKIMALASEVSQ